MKLLHRFQWPFLFLAIAAYLYFPVWSLWTAGLSSNDFKHIYLGMKAILDSNSPYSLQALHHQAARQGYSQISLNPYVYLPFTGHTMAFLAPLRLDQAVFAWFLLNHIFTIISLTLVSRIFGPARIAALAFMLLSFSFSAPFFRNLSAGQLNMALLLLITLSWHALRAGRPRLSGAIMAFATLYKLMPGLYGLYFLLRRKWQALLSMAATGVLLLAISILLTGPAMYADFIPVLQQMSYGRSTWPEFFSFWDDPANQSLNALFSHIFTTNDHTTPWIILGQPTANLCTSLITLWLLVAYSTQNLIKLPASPTTGSTTVNTSTDEAAWCATLILALLIPSLLWDHYLVMLVLPVAWLIHAALTTKRFTTAGVVIVCYALTCLPWNFDAAPWRSGAGILLMSLKLWPTLVLFGLTLCFMRWSVEYVPLAEGHQPGD